MSERLTRQQIYDRIRSSSKDSYVLEEMQRLGFWESSIPTLSETIIKREAEINKELRELLEKDRRYQNQEAMLKEMRKERMKKAKERREETKKKNKQKSLDKAARWKQLQLGQVLYLGKGVSAGLNNTASDSALLRKYNLLVFDSVAGLAEKMNVDLSTLRYLLFHRKVSKISHYHIFEIPKKSGGRRKIAAPKKKLKNLQNWVLENILNQFEINEYAHGFVKQRSIVTNANVHTGQDIVINIDLKDFFPSIDYKRVKGLFQKIGYSEQLAIIFALICTQAETKTVLMDGVTYYVQNNKRFLPQGSPASPAISNLIAFRLDKKVQGLAAKYGFVYSRYADDLSFSTSSVNEKNIAALLYFLNKIISEEGLTINREKTTVMRKSGQQKVTGIVVNEKLNIDRKQLRKFRALLHNIEVNGWKDQKWGKSENAKAAIEGYIHFIKMVNQEKAKQFEEKWVKIVAKHGYPEIKQIAEEKPVQQKEQAEKEIQTGSTEQTLPKEAVKNNTDWWNIFS